MNSNSSRTSRNGLFGLRVGSRVVTSIALASLLGACSGTDRTGLALLDQHVNLDALLDGVDSVIGLNVVDDTLRWFSSISDAAFLGTSHIVVLDRSAPHLRIFHRNVELTAAYLPKGQGPGEAERPLSLTTNDRQEILVLHDRRLSLFSLDEGYITTQRVGGVTPRDIGRGCSGWLLYGPEGEWGDGEEKHWTHRIEFDDEGMDIIPTGLLDDVRPDRLSMGSGKVAGGPGGWVLHDVAYPRTLHSGCEASPSIPVRQLRDMHAVLYRPPPEVSRSDGNLVQMGIRAGDMSPTGFALQGSDVLLSVSIFNPGGDFNSMLIHFTDEGLRAGSSSRGLRVRDISSDGELLLIRSEPVPHLVVAPAAEVLAALSGR